MYLNPYLLHEFHWDKQVSNLDYSISDLLLFSWTSLTKYSKEAFKQSNEDKELHQTRECISGHYLTSKTHKYQQT